MSQTETWTVQRLLTWTTDFLRNHGSDSPRLEAEVLLAESLGWERIALYTHFADEPAEPVRTRFRDLVRRRAGGEPVAYLVGHKEFHSLSFRVTSDVLIPRPETELLVITLLDLAKPRGQTPLSICDVGTGSGIIAVTVAKHLPHARVTAIDSSPAALNLAKENARRHGVEDRIAFLESDLLAATPADSRFDFIASNPPYVSESEFASLAPGVRDHEPRAALLAGARGDEVIERLLPQAADRLAPGGCLLVEISPMIHESVVALFSAEARFSPAQTVKDLSRHPRVVWASRT